MKKQLAVLAILLFATALYAATTSYQWTGAQVVKDSPTDYILDGTFTDNATNITLTLSLPQWYTPFRNGVYYPNGVNWTLGSVCQQKAPYPSLSFEETVDGNKVLNTATVASITCESTYDSSTQVLTENGTFSGLNEVTNQPFTGTFEIVMSNDGYGVKQWTAHSVAWSVGIN